MTKSKNWAIILALVGGLILYTTLLAGFLPFFYNAGIVYYGFGWYKIGIAIAGLLIGMFGLFTYLTVGKKKK
jgi:hypothetical protein